MLLFTVMLFSTQYVQPIQKVNRFMLTILWTKRLKKSHHNNWMAVIISPYYCIHMHSYTVESLTRIGVISPTLPYLSAQFLDIASGCSSWVGLCMNINFTVFIRQVNSWYRVVYLNPQTTGGVGGRGVQLIWLLTGKIKMNAHVFMKCVAAVMIHHTYTFRMNKILWLVHRSPQKVLSCYHGSVVSQFQIPKMGLGGTDVVIATLYDAI